MKRASRCAVKGGLSVRSSSRAASPECAGRGCGDGSGHLGEVAVGGGEDAVAVDGGYVGAGRSSSAGIGVQRRGADGSG